MLNNKDGSDEIRRSIYLLFIPMLFISMLLELIHLPEPINSYRPDCMILVLIYFTVFDARRVNLEIAWLAGFLYDLLTGAPLGSNGFMLVIQLYLIQTQFRRFALFAWYQQAVVIGIINFIGHIIGYWLGHIFGPYQYETFFFYPTLVTAAFWQMVSFVSALFCQLLAIYPTESQA